MLNRSAARFFGLPLFPINLLMYDNNLLTKIYCCSTKKSSLELRCGFSSKQKCPHVPGKVSNQRHPVVAGAGNGKVRLKVDPYQVITDRVITLLEQGVIPWQKPWQSGELMPRNLASGREYRGVNVFLLHAVSYESPFWLTYRQAQELGGNVRRGEKACPVVFWKWLDVDESAQPDGRKRVPLLRYYSVFNVAQCEGIPHERIPALNRDRREHNPIAEAERIVAAMPKRPAIQHKWPRAFYSPDGDFVGIPEPALFHTAEDYYSVLFHELTHATGHECRLNRKGVSGSDGLWSAFGSQSYSKEELVAEMGAAFLCGQAGIVERTLENSAAYVGSWLQRLKDDRRLVVHAAAQAQKAADYILGRQFAEESGVES